MKDKELREKVRDISRMVDYLEKTVGELNRNPLEGVTVRHCPTCKHGTLQTHIEKGHSWTSPLAESYVCLTCGDKFEQKCKWEKAE